MEYYDEHIVCDWCGYSTRGEIVDEIVVCTSCRRKIIDDIIKVA